MDPSPVDASKIIFKPGKGLQVLSEDGQFSMTTRLRTQLRYTLDNAGGALGQGLQLRRARLQFTGNLFGPHNGLFCAARDEDSSRLLSQLW
jgi:hypothetical protein